MAEALVLKRGPKRTVLLQRSGGARPVIVKRFHDPELLGRLVDGWRARREERRLRALSRAGLPAPEPLERRRRAGRWELVQQYVEGATLDELLDGAAPWPVARRRVAGALGLLLAALEGAGFEHRDAHAGNVLIDAQGAPWILDARNVVTRGASRTAPERGAFLAALCAGVRERASLGFRRRVYESYAGAPATPGTAATPRPPDPLAIEDEARARREAHVRARLERWLRVSGATVRRRRGAGFVVRERPAGRYRLSPPLAADEWLRRWTTHARWVEHGLPCLAPVAAYPRGRRSRIVTAIPAGAVRLTGAPDPAALGGLLGAVHDRGIGLPALAWSELWRGADGSLLLDAPVAMTLERADRTRPWEAKLPWDWSALTPAARRAFVTAHARATRHSRAEREALEREGAGG